MVDYISFIQINLMGQGLTLCEGCYYTQCNECIGLSWGMFCCGCWMFPPPALEYMRGPNCCVLGCNQGLGSTCFCTGNYCCIPDWLRNYSIWKSVGNRRGNFFDIDIIDRNNVQPYGFVGNQLR
jgi:hypothetical protein